MSVLLDDCEAMAPLLAAFARGTKRSRLRQLVVVCEKGHTLAEVFPTAQGPHAVWKQRQVTRWLRPAGTVMPIDADPLMHTGSDTEYAAPLEVDGVWLIGVCRCTEHAVIRHEDLLTHIASGRQRVVHSA
jgi:hypothetical protein